MYHTPLLPTLTSLPSPHLQRLGVTSTRRDAEFGIQDRVHSLFKVPTICVPSLWFAVESLVLTHTAWYCREQSRDSRLAYSAAFRKNVFNLLSHTDTHTYTNTHTHTQTQTHTHAHTHTHTIHSLPPPYQQDDIRLWLQYIDFCQKSRHHISLGKVLAKALALHPTKPGTVHTSTRYMFIYSVS